MTGEFVLTCAIAFHDKEKTGTLLRKRDTEHLLFASRLSNNRKAL